MTHNHNCAQCRNSETVMTAAEVTLVRNYGLSEDDAPEALRAIGYAQLLEALRTLLIQSKEMIEICEFESLDTPAEYEAIAQAESAIAAAGGG